MKNKTGTSYKSSNIQMLWVCLPFFALAIILSVVSILVQNNGVLRSSGLLISFINLICSLCDIVIYATSFAFIIRAITIKKTGIIPFVCFVAMSAFRYFVSAVIGGVIYGAVSGENMISAASVLASDTVIMGILLVVSYILCKRSTDKETKEANAKCRFLPDLSNTANKGIFIAGAVWAAIRVISLIIYDVIYISMLGAPSAINIVWMVIYYLCAALICPVFYFISRCTLKLTSKAQESSF